MKPRTMIAALLMAVVSSLVVARVAEAEFMGNHFVVTADPRDNHTRFGNTLAAMNLLVGGPGMFHVSPGDVDQSIPDNRAQIDLHHGANALWYPGVGNHEKETGADMTWLRNEYNNGNGVRTPLKNFTNQDGPATCKETNYSWDDPATNTHYVQLNEYWNGFSDTGANGDVVPALRTWLATDLAENRGKATFVFGHEPAFPENRHVGDSLDQHPVNRDAFWALLEAEGVEAFFVGHTHYYSRHQEPGGEVWQIDAGAAGNGSYNEGETFVDVVLLDGEVRYDVYKNYQGGSTSFQLHQRWIEPANCVPEPSTLVLILTCSIGYLAYSWRKRRSLFVK